MGCSGGRHQSRHAQYGNVNKKTFHRLGFHVTLAGGISVQSTNWHAHTERNQQDAKLKVEDMGLHNEVVSL